MPAPDDIDAFLEALAARGVAQATRRAYRSDLEVYRRWLDTRGTEPRRATRADVRAYAAALSDRGLATASRARTLSAIRGLHRRLHDLGLADQDPASEVAGPRRRTRLPSPPAPADVARMLDGPWPDDPTALRDKALFELLYGCGLRIGEACALDLDAIGSRGVRVHGKGGKVRVVPIGEPARRALDGWVVRGRSALAREEAGDALFLGRRGRRLDPTSARRALRARLEATGVTAFGPHALRHAYATDMLDGGADLRAIQELLGHSSLGTTEIYTHIGVPHLRRAHARSHPRG